MVNAHSRLHVIPQGLSSNEDPIIVVSIVVLFFHCLNNDSTLHVLQSSENLHKLLKYKQITISLEILNICRIHL